jgi:hypothetical protein
LRTASSVLLVLLLAASAWAQATEGPSAARKSRTLGGRCGSANWVCVARCIDVSCVERCLAEGCEQALEALERCASQSGCGMDDSACVARVCGRQCNRTFEPAPPSPVREVLAPCAESSAGAGAVPEEVVGRWSLEAASLQTEPAARSEGQLVDPTPRADYERSLEVTPGGCFLLRTKLEDATLGRGNVLEIRSWGSFQVDEKAHTVEVRTKSGQAVGTVCGKPRVISLSKGRFEPLPPYAYDVEGDTLTLTAKDPSKQTFQFRRQEPEQAK